VSSVNLTSPTNEAFADIKEEIHAEEAADPTKKKLGALFWICAGWIVLVALAATFANLLPLPNPDLGNYSSAQNAGPGWGHLLGTDDLYRDIFSRLIYGARVSLGGLAQRLVQDGVMNESAMLEAVAKSQEKRVSLVTHLVASNLATARDIAISASNEFGVPLLDLDVVVPDADAIRAVSQKLMQKHRVLPLMKRGKRLFLAVADPTDLHALDEIRAHPTGAFTGKRRDHHVVDRE